MGEELWKVIPEFNFYEVSNCGRIRCKERKVKREKSGDYIYKEHFLKPVDNGNGYFRVMLKQEGRKKKFYVHRLVAMAFISNPDNKPYINHIDNNPSNNRVENLEWCTHQENMDWMISQGRNKRNGIWLKHLHESQEKYYKPVIGINIKTGEELHFKYLNEVKNSGFQPSCVSCCCNGIHKTHKGYIWKFEKKEVVL